MSEILGCNLEYGISSDFRLNDKIHIFSSSELSQTEIIAPLILILHAIEKQMEIDSLSFDIGFPINCFFSEKDEFTIRLSPDQKAICVKLVFYPLSRLALYYGSKTLYMILAEELCHLIWNIHDEMLVSFKVFDVLRNIFPDLDIQEIYSQEIAAQHRKWVADHPPASPS